MTINKKNYYLRNFLIYLPLIFLYFPALYVAGVPVCDIIIAFVLLILFIFTKSFSHLFSFLKYRYFRILLLYVVYIFLSGVILVMMGKYNLQTFMYETTVQFFINNMMWYIYCGLICPRFISLKNLIRILLVAIFLLCLYACFEYICIKLNINLLQSLKYVLINRRTLFYEDRAQAFFDEPGYFGGFLCINLPIIYNVILSKFKILRHNRLNFVFRKLYLPIVWCAIFAVKSPIWIVFSIIVTLIYFYKKILKPKAIIPVVIIMMSVLCIFLTNNSNISDSLAMYRIKAVLYNFKNPALLVVKDPSLGNRIISYNARYHVFLENPIIGVGYKNTENYAYPHIIKSSLGLTKEMMGSIHKTYNKKSKQYILINGSILWISLGDTGIIGAILFYSFLIYTILKMKQIAKLLEYSLERNFINGVSQSILCIIIFSFYDIRCNFVYFWFLYGLASSFIIYAKQRKLIVQSKIVEGING